MNNRIREFRARHSLTQDELAHYIARIFSSAIEEIFIFDDEQTN
jgi:DNA-binding XRE family transcriptional regulator